MVLHFEHNYKNNNTNEVDLNQPNVVFNKEEQNNDSMQFSTHMHTHTQDNLEEIELKRKQKRQQNKVITL